MQSLDFIELKEILVHAKIGCTEAERAFPQRLNVSLRIGIPPWDLETQRGKLEQTVCWESLLASVNRLATGEEWILLEDFVTALIERVFEDSLVAEQVIVHVEKYALPGVGACGFQASRTKK